MATDRPTEYEPRYVGVEDVPIEIPDDYTDAAKREALWQAEYELEIDRNGGEALDDDDVTPVHMSAVANLATYYLCRGATDPGDVTLGDLEDGGDQTQGHSRQYQDTYEHLIEKISEAGEGGQSGTYYGATGSGTGAIAVNTRNYPEDDPIHDYT